MLLPHATGGVRKRPAAQQQGRPYAKQRCTPQPVQYVAEDFPTERADWQTPINVGDPPQWAKHVVDTFVQQKNIQPANGGNITLQMWSDCGGLAVEMMATKEVSDALLQSTGLTVKWSLYCACEKDQRTREFIKANYTPLHTSDDMLHRDLTQGQYYCDQCAANHDIPREGIDVYVAGYRCSPWSKKGRRPDFNHPDAQSLLIGIHTVNHIRPAVWLMETTECDHIVLDKVRDHIQNTLQGVHYHSHIVRNFNPTWSGYPTLHPRVFILNWRADVCPADLVLRPIDAVLANPFPLVHNYYSFLGLSRPTDWSRVDEYPNSSEQVAMQSNSDIAACQCSVDPMVVCQLHPCRPSCGHCGQTGANCLWRRKMMNFLTEKLPTLASPRQQGKLTYLQVLELSGLKGPTHPRQRNCLNVFALLPQSRPLNDTLLLADLNQSVDAMVLQQDGSLPTLARNSSIFCLQAGRVLTSPEKAALMGISLGQVRFPAQCTEAWFKERLALSTHLASMGTMLLSLVAVPLQQMDL